MDPTGMEGANRLAAALDAEDYDEATAILASQCVYESPDGILIGPDAIIRSYRDNGDRARLRFDEVIYSSDVEQIGDEFVVTYSDELRLGDQRHEFRCRQWLRVNPEGRIIAIRHEEIAGERERLAGFEQQ